MKSITAVLLVAVACGCQRNPPVAHTTALETLTGVVIRKDWSKSLESWNAGGSEYYVLKIEGSALPPGTQTAKEGVTLLPSDTVPFGHFTNFVGRLVTCRGQFVAGEPYIPPEDSVEQMPLPSENLITGKTEYPIVGAGFKVHVIEPVERKTMKVIGIYPIKASEPVHMIEMSTEDSITLFDLSSITQEVSGQPKENWQVPYMEHILNQDGTEILANDLEIMAKPELLQGNLRLVFFFHYLDLQKPLISPWGKIILPDETEKPERIKIQYEEP